jgi:hypothetical protein
VPFELLAYRRFAGELPSQYAADDKLALALFEERQQLELRSGWRAG